MRQGATEPDDEYLTRFNATIRNYEERATDIKDHLSRTSRGLSILLNLVEKAAPASALGAFLIAWLGQAAKNRRLQLSGNEAGNGLEMWRQLCREYKGTGELIEASGRKLLNEFPQCK